MLNTADERAAPLPKPNSNAADPGLVLVGMVCVVVGLADQRLAGGDIDGSRHLVELAMSISHTAGCLAPSIDDAVRDARQRVDQAIDAVRQSSRRQPCAALQDAGDPDDQWPFHIV